MQYDAITLDTNVFDRNGLVLESGLLAQMTQFSGGSAQFIMSEIVLREVHRHLVEKAKNSRDDFIAATKRAIEHGVIADDNRTALDEISKKSIDPSEAAKLRIEKYLKETGAEIIPADTTDIRALIKSYFELSPPFEGSGKKKNEFPDAIALLSLEAWAVEKGIKILAVSYDKGWAEFAAKSHHIDVLEDLPGALSMLQKDTEHAQKVMNLVLKRLVAGEDPDFLSDIEAHVSDEVSSASVFPEAASSFYYEPDFVELELQKLDFRYREGELDMDIVAVGAGRIVTRLGIEVFADASTSFSFQVKDGIDKDYVSIGGCHAATEISFPASILVTLEGDFSNLDELDYVASGIELIGMIDTVDFGEVEPDFGEDYYD